MNIFYLDKEPDKAVLLLIDKHVVKMVLESAQLLCTAHRVLDGEHYIDSSSGRRLQRWRHSDKDLDEKLYKATHFNHPCSLWLRSSKENYIWLYNHFIALGQEYKKRYGKEHASIVKLADILENVPQNAPDIPFTEPPQAMPDEHKVEGDSVSAYHNYYRNDKLRLGTVKDRERYFEIMKIL